MLKILIPGLFATTATWFFVSEDRMLNIVENDLGKQIESAFTDSDEEAVDYFVAGRDVILQIHKADDSSLDTVRDKIATIPGVAQVLKTGAVEPSEVAMAAAALSNSNSHSTFAEVRFADNSLKLIGVAGAATRSAEILAQLDPGIEVIDYLEYKNKAASSEWLSMLAAFTESLPAPGAGRVLMTDKAISVVFDDDYAASEFADSLRARGITRPVRVSTRAGATVAVASNDYSARENIVQGCNARLDELLNGSPIAFKFNSDEIEEQSVQTLQKVSDLIVQCDNAILIVSGHTDSLGSSELNQQLSQRRASTVRAQIVRNGVEESRVDAIGFGEEYPIADNDTREGRAINRRIELRFGIESGS